MVNFRKVGTLAQTISHTTHRRLTAILEDLVSSKWIVRPATGARAECALKFGLEGG
jgi:hypothetical protein